VIGIDSCRDAPGTGFRLTRYVCLTGAVAFILVALVLYFLKSLERTGGRFETTRGVTEVFLAEAPHAGEAAASTTDSPSR
jgi:hypothetical protein